MKDRLQTRARRKTGRLLVLTGARQTGKTTLAREVFRDMAYLSFEDPVVRPAYSRMSGAEWIARYPRAILDEVQKAPSVVEAIRAAYDASPGVRYLLLGSSQILLLSRVRESMAGRAALEELWPLTLPELATTSWSDPVRESRLLCWLRERPLTPAVLAGVPAADGAFSRACDLFERYLRLGGMPAVHDPELTTEETEVWLRDYQRTYLERDVADLAALRDLEPFVLAQKALALRTGCLLNYTDLARDAGVAPATARRFLTYLEMSYQVLTLRPFHRNRTKRLMQTPKVHFLDPGVHRSITGRRGPLTGEEYESAVIAEIVKQVRGADLRLEFHHLRTYDGREIDLLIEAEDGFAALEIKRAERVGRVDGRHLRDVGELLDKPLLGALVLSSDPEVKDMGDGVLAVPAAWALGTGP